MGEATATGTGHTAGDGLHYVILVQLTALSAWLALSRERRNLIVEEQVTPVFAAHPCVQARWIDVEAFTADSSDVLLVETDDLRVWNRVFEALRDTSLFSVPYFRLDRLLIGAEDGFRDYEAVREP